MIEQHNENRPSYRKNLKVAGTLVHSDKEISFFTRTMSLSGFEAYCEQSVLDATSFEEGDMVQVSLPMLNLQGIVSILWTGLGEDGLFSFGFKFINMRGVEGSTYRYREAEQSEAGK